MGLGQLIGEGVMALAKIGIEAYGASQEKQEELKKRFLDTLADLRAKLEALPAALAANDAAADKAAAEKFGTPPTPMEKAFDTSDEPGGPSQK